ncbi:MAG: HDOD domain-containing protein [Defluviitaleaceae bacterium]|nr:HDOD domain-containing protein [Defluviitaleaceae bacterium]
MRDMTVLAYCFRYESAHDYIAHAPARAFDGVVNPPGLDILERVGIDAFTNGAPLFVPISKFALLSDMSQKSTQPPNQIIFLFNHTDITPEEPFLSSIKALKQRGYRFAIENPRDVNHLHPILELCDFVILGFKYNMNNMTTFRQLAASHKHLEFIAADINGLEIFSQLDKTNFKYFEGRFYNVPVSKDQSTMSPVKINRIHLLNTVQEEDFAIESVADIVGRDPSMSISLLKLVNSPHLGISQKIKSIQHAVAMLGQKEVRKWVTTVIANLLAEDKPGELTRLSLLRAKFAENMARHFHLAMQANDLFLLGLFSILDAALDMPMEDALKLIHVSEEIHTALVERKGRFMKILNFILAYEAADWTEVKNTMMLHDISAGDVFESYMETVSWYDSILNEAYEVEA